jgi:hypothetical protein
MTGSQVERIMGCPGKEIAKSKARRATIVTYEWKGAEYSVIYVVFRNNKVFSKTSANLSDTAKPKFTG